MSHPIPIRTDPELGPVKVCTRCLEEWPADLEFFYANKKGLTSQCKDCWNISRRPQVRTRVMA